MHESGGKRRTRDLHRLGDHGITTASSIHWQFSRDMTEDTRSGKFHGVVGRTKVIDRLIQTSCRMTGRNSLLIGEAGVGKSTCIRAFAERIVRGDVPEGLRDRRLVMLDVPAMLAGCKYVGSFEERLTTTIEAAERDHVILFIDELHTVIGAGAVQGGIPAADVLKPALSRGELQVVGATTLREYRESIEKDTALARRFQTILVEPTNREETLAILGASCGQYEAYHGVRFTDQALVAAVDLSSRYVTDRVLPSKAVDLIDEAAARVQLGAATRTGNAVFPGPDEFRSSSHSIVDEEAIAEVVSDMTGIPLTRLTTEDSVRLARMEDALRAQVVGQENALEAVARCVRRSRSGLKDPCRPTGCFIFAGPTGSGKTLLAKSLAEYLFEDRESLVQIDMSEYSEKYAVSRLIGAPPGYVGYEQGGQLTERIRRRPYSVVLLDEIEKAHPEIFNMLLQVMEEGRLTDAFGRKADFRNVIVIMTTNAGAQAIKNEAGFGFQRPSQDADYESMKTRVQEHLAKVFLPEFLARVDDVIIFQQLTSRELGMVLELELAKVRRRLAGRGWTLRITQAAKATVIKRVLNQELGARPLRRAVERFILDQLSEKLLKGASAGTAIVDANGQHIVVQLSP